MDAEFTNDALDRALTCARKLGVQFGMDSMRGRYVFVLDDKQLNHLMNLGRQAAKYEWIRDHPEIIDWDDFPWAKDYEHPDWALDSTADMLDCSIEAVLEQQENFSAGDFDD